MPKLYSDKIVIVTLIIFAFFVGWFWKSRFSNESFQQVRLCVPKLPFSGLAIVAAEQGFFLEQGVEAHLEYEALGAQCMFRLNSRDKVDLAIALLAPAYRTIAAYPELGILTETHSSNSAAGIVYARDRGIKRPEDLKGKSIAVVQGTDSDYFLKMFLMAHEMVVEDVVIVPTTPSQILYQIRKRKVDAAVMWEPLLSSAVKEDANLNVFQSSFYTEFSVLVGSRRYLLERRLGERVIAALRRAEEYLATRDRNEVFRVWDWHPRSWNTYTFKVGLSAVLVSMLEQQYLFLNPKLFDEQDAYQLRAFLLPEPIKRVAPEAVTYQ